MPERMDTLAALQAIAEGRRVPRSKYGALQRGSLIRIIGHGPRSHPVVTDAGRAKLAEAERGRHD